MQLNAVYGKPSPTRCVLDCNRAGEGWKAWLGVDQGWYIFSWYWRVYFLIAGLVVAIEKFGHIEPQLVLLGVVQLGKGKGGLKSRVGLVHLKLMTPS